MKRSQYYDMRLPERGAREGEANDPADIEDLTYDLEIVDEEMERQRQEDMRLDREKASRQEFAQHKAAEVLDHPDGSVTDAKIGSRTVLSFSGTLQVLLTAIGEAIRSITGTKNWNDAPAATIAELEKSKVDLADVLTRDNTEEYLPKLPYHPATKKYVDETLQETGSGDMTKSVYDPNGNGIVDNAERLGGKLPDYYAAAQDMTDLLEGVTPAGAVDGGTY